MLNCPKYCKGVTHSPSQRVIHVSKWLFGIKGFSTITSGIFIFIIMFVISSTATLPFFDSKIQPQSSKPSKIKTTVLAAHTTHIVTKSAVVHLLSPTPTGNLKKTIVVISVAPTKIPAIPTATPIPTHSALPANPTTVSQPTQTQQTTQNNSSNQDAVNQLLGLINSARSSHGAPPLSLSDKISGCALSHSQAMAARNGLFHDLATDACDSSYHSQGENVGMGTAPTSETINTVHNNMMNEGPGGMHYENIINGTYKVIGIGIYVANGTTWITEDFEG